MLRRIIPLLIPLLLLTVGCGGDVESSKRRLLESGNRYFESGKLREASIFYQRAIQQDRRFGEAYYRLGLTELQLGRYSPALAALTRACELQPKNRDAYAKLSDLYILIMGGNPKDKEAFLAELARLTDRAEENFPDAFEIHRVRGIIAWAQEDYESATQRFRLALEKKPDDAGAALGLARALTASGKDDEAETFSRSFVAEHKDAIDVYDFLYGHLYEKGRHADALAVLEAKSSNNPDNLNARIQIARHYLMEDDRERMATVLDGILARPNAGATEYGAVGEFYGLAREYDRAIAVFRKAQDVIPAEKVTFQLKIVETLAAQGRNPEAFEQIEAVLKENPENTDAMALRGALRLRSGDKKALQGAITDLEAALAQNQDNVVLRYSLGEAYLAIGNRDRAIIEFQQVIDKRPDFLAPRYGLARVYLMNQDYARAVSVAEEILKLRPDDDRAQLIRSYAWVNLGEGKQARSTLEELLVKRPNAPEPTYQLARISMMEKNYREAERLYQKLATASPPDPRGILGVAEAMAYTNRRDEALELLRKQVNEGQNDDFWRLAYGVAATRWGAWPQAEQALKAVVENQPDNENAYKHLAGVYYQTQRINLAEQNFQRAAELAPADPAPQLYLGLILERKGQPAQAAARYQRVLELTPGNVVALNNLAMILADTGGDLDRALTLAQRAIGAAPDTPDIAATLSWIYIKKNLNDSAIRILEGLLAKQPRRVSWRYHLAMALFQKGDYERAKRELDTALKSNPSQEEETNIRRLLAKVNA